MASPLILPGTLAYDLALAEIPPVPTWRKEAERTNGETYLIALPGSCGLMEAVSRQRWLEYCNDGELDQRMEEVEAHEQSLSNVIF
jgi:hypothetical protein